jgi:cytochrome P450
MSVTASAGDVVGNHALSTDIDVTSDAFWALPFAEREKSFARLRAESPVSWHLPRPAPEVPAEYREEGIWAITKHADIQRVSQDHETFSSDFRRGFADFRAVDPRMVGAPTFHRMDPPEHTRFRQVMSRAFTPKAVAHLSQKINERAAAIVDGIADGGSFDFVETVAAKLPMQTVADLVGVPESLVHTFAEAGDRIVGAMDPDFLAPGGDRTAYVSAQFEVLTDIGVDLIAHRRTHPADDLATALANVDMDGRGAPMDAPSIRAMMALLSVAGNDTTKQTTSRTVVQLWRDPAQKAWLMEDYDARIVPSVEEFIRFASPVMTFARFAVRDVEIRGQHIVAGDKVVLFYNSGNRDEEVWPDAERFDLQRERRPHVGFGGGGVHYCLGNGVAKAQLRALFQQILTRVPDMEVGEPEPLRSDFINGIKHLPVRVG